jgi:hypothetical protein
MPNLAKGKPVPDKMKRKIFDRVKLAIGKQVRKIEKALSRDDLPEPVTHQTFENRLRRNDLSKPITNQPSELLEMVGFHLVTEDPAKTAINLANFERVSHQTHGAIGGRLLDYKDALKVILPEARAAFDMILPEDRAFGRNERRVKD